MEGQSVTEKALQARREYRRRYYQANKEKIRQWNEQYWERQAERTGADKGDNQEAGYERT